MFECLYGYADVQLGSHGLCLSDCPRSSFPPFVSNSVSPSPPCILFRACFANFRMYPPRTIATTPMTARRYAWLCLPNIAHTSGTSPDRRS